MSGEGVLIEKPLRVKIIYAELPRTYVNEQKRSMQVVEGVLADETTFRKFSCYNKSAFPFMKTGHSVMIINFLSKLREIVLRTGTRVILIPTSSLEVPADVETHANKEAELLKSPPTAGLVTVQQSLEIPQGSLFNIICKITKLDDIQTVTTSYGTDVTVRNGEMGDETGSVCFAFWRHLATFPLEVGQCVKVNNGVMSSTTDGLPKVTSRQRTSLEIVPSDKITTVKPFESESFQETGKIIGMSSLHVFAACSKAGCFHRGLKDMQCPKCKTTYTDEDSSKSAVCEVVVSKPDEERDEITLFHSQIIELLRGTDKTIIENHDQLLDDIMHILPKKVTYTPSPKKDKTLSSFRKLD